MEHKDYEKLYMEHAKNLGIFNAIISSRKFNVKYSDNPIKDVEKTYEIIKGKKWEKF